MKLWDTNIISELARRQPQPSVLEWVKQEEDPAVSVVTIDELFFGLRWRPHPRIQSWLESFLDTRCEILPVTEDIARLGGELRGEIRAKGQVRAQADMWIAATARIHGLPLVTRNVKDFEGCGVEIINPFQ